ncbi:hypothetical protein [Carboxylicivirga sediminis]|nr:hypothetical protein [Carboxylicivirga sediminis]
MSSLEKVGFSILKKYAVMTNPLYPGASAPFTIKAKRLEDGSITAVTNMKSIEAICIHKHTGTEIKKFFYDPTGETKEGYVNFHVPVDKMSITATMSEAETDALEEGTYDMMVVLRYYDARFEGGVRTAKYKALWFTIKKK